MAQQSNATPQLFKLCRAELFSASFFSLFINLLMLAMPLYMLQIFERVITTGNLATLAYLTVIALFAFVVMGFLITLRSRILTSAGERFDSNTSPEVLKAQFSSVLASSKSRDAQPLRDVQSVRNFLSGSGITALFDAPWVPIFIIAIFSLHPYQGLVALVGAALLFFLALFNEWSNRSAIQETNNSQSAALNEAQAYLRNAETIVAMGMTPQVRNSWEQSHANISQKLLSVGDRTSIFTGLGRAIRVSLQILILAVGAWLAIRGEIGPGSMFVGAILMGRALAPVEQAMGAWKGLVNARQAYGRITTLLAEADQGGEGLALPQPSGELRAEQVIYYAPGTRKPLVKQVQFQLAPGEVLGIAGPSGAGKTTLGKLLIGALKPQMGTVRLDGADISAFSPGDRGRFLGYLAQEIELFRGTIADNIARMGAVDDAAVVEAAQRAHVHDLILSLPEGYETKVGPGGVMLSNGQRQRIGLARALYGDPALIVLDEPNSNLDSEGDVALIETIKELKAAGKTVVAIAHRPSILNVVDRLLVLKEGAIAAFGPTQEVMRQLNQGQKKLPGKQGASGGKMTPRRLTMQRGAEAAGKEQGKPESAGATSPAEQTGKTAAQAADTKPAGRAGNVGNSDTDTKPTEESKASESTEAAKANDGD
ncbi:type I secretion system permease/ATPase [Rhodovibrionaceae bacterium A322]